ncbi:MAG: hypothetical protein V7K68_30500 [Nostoc sp.]
MTQTRVRLWTLTLPELKIRGFLLQRDSSEFTLSKHRKRISPDV